MEYKFSQQSWGDRLFSIVNYVFLAFMALLVLYPLIYIVSASFSSSNAVISGRVWLWPVEPNLEGYKAIFKNSMITTGFTNSIIYTVAGTSINVILTVLAAYPLSRHDFVGRNYFMFLFVFTMMFTGGLIPTYLLVQDLGLTDTRWAMLLPTALSVWNMIITRTYFQTTLPTEMLEAAHLDGCSDLKFLWKIVIPLSGPILAVITLFYAVSQWNQYFNALIYLKDRDLYPLQIVLREILVQNQVDLNMLTDVEQAAQREGLRELLKYSLIVVSSAPLLLIYPFVQKFFVKGIMIGSLKG
ncbi:carbohydrate ABC transporter permease [Paenibacillus sepulcri]|uniref:Carbohydrate ABC transporter permease n=1 Tax=Paenibacillus sepulcri TaxID=359917 RepID=A0ABS7C6B7_9BACL|nr:carbohydrate ABC transporter permease [Paenibacillus sepulcri]